MDVVVERFDIYIVRISTLAEKILNLDMPTFLKREKEPDASRNILNLSKRNQIIGLIVPSELNTPKKSQLCVVISPDEANRHLYSVIVAPMTIQSKPYPTRVVCHFEDKEGYILLDQLRAVHKRYLEKKVGELGQAEARQVLSVLGEMFAE